MGSESGRTMKTHPLLLGLACAAAGGRPAAAPAQGPGPGPRMTLSTYLGGAGEDSVRDVFVDSGGFVYATGGTASADFAATPGAYAEEFGGVHDAYAVKLDPDGRVVFATLLGGPEYDRAYAIEVDAEGFVYVAGRAGDDFPTTKGALQRRFGGDSKPNDLYGKQDGFVCKLSPDGSELVWSTYFGGRGRSVLRDLAVDAEGCVYVVATQVDRKLPHVSKKSFGRKLRGDGDGFVAKISADGEDLIYGGYLGGGDFDGGTPSVRVDAAGHAYVLTHTRSDDLPVSENAYQKQPGGDLDLMLVKVAPDGRSLVYCTYFGGSGVEFTETHGLAVDHQGQVVIAATTRSPDLPAVAVELEPPFQPRYGGSGQPGSGARTNYPGDGFVARFSADGSTLVGFTYLGGGAGEGIEGCAVDGEGRVYVSGATFSPDFPLPRETLKPAFGGDSDAFLARLSPDLTALEAATFWGGSGRDEGRSLAVTPEGVVVLCGMTWSGDMQTTPNAPQPRYRRGEADGFLLRIDP